MSDIDHKAEAESRIDWTFRGGATDSERASMVAKAQVHATLYLAEQQKRAADYAEKQNVALASILVVLSAGLSNGQQQAAARGLVKIGAGS